MAVSLAKGQKISLEKEAGTPLTRVVMGLGWDVEKKKGLFGGGGGSIDLDASCVLFDTDNRMVDSVWFRQLASKDGSITHSGDNRTGAGEGDDETIMVDLTRVPASVRALVFCVTSFTGQSFDKVQNAYCRLVDAQTKKEIARFNLSAQGPHTGQIMSKVYRHNNEWKMHAIGESTSGRTFQDMMTALQASL